MNLRVIGPNQTELTIGDVVVLFSYNTPVAARLPEGYIRTGKHWSSTTSKHINRWIGSANYVVVDQREFDRFLEFKPE